MPSPQQMLFIEWSTSVHEMNNEQYEIESIKAEGAELTIVAGDTSYSSSRDDDWDAMVRNTLGVSDPAIVVAGNHDYGDSTFSNVRSFGQNRLKQNHIFQIVWKISKISFQNHTKTWFSNNHDFLRDASYQTNTL